jgi:hypothetical protein
VSNRFETTLIVAPLKGVVLESESEVPLSNGLFLARAEAYHTTIERNIQYFFLSRVQAQDVMNAKWLLGLRRTETPERSVDIPNTVEDFQDGLMAFQIVKPTETYGVIFHGRQLPDGSAHLSGLTDRRWPMAVGRWAQLRAFDEPLLKQTSSIVERVRALMKGSDIPKRNAVHSLQLALEHPHPYVSCLLAVMGMEAILDSNDRRDFESKLCGLLGKDTPAFPDWNSPEFRPPNYSVHDLAVPVYMLRSKVAHGVDLRRAAADKHSPVDLLEFKEYITTPFIDYEQRTDAVQYAQLLGEASIYLLCQLLQNVLNTAQHEN